MHHKYGKGFTIVELLVVVVLIGILAAITIVAYNGIQARARASQASTALTQAKKKLELYKVDNNAYPTSANLAAAGVVNADTTYQYTSDGTIHCLTATATNVSYYLNSTTQTNPAPGGCPGHGQAGVAAITNLVINPSFETGIAGWSTVGATIAAANDWAAGGTGSVKLTNTQTADGGDVRLNGSGGTTFPLGMSPGQTYTASAMVHIPVSLTGSHVRSPRVMFFYSLNSGATYVSDFGPQSPTVAGDYRVSYSFTVPPAATGVVLGFGGSSSTIGHTVSYDQVMVTVGATTYTYADGNSPNWVWNGAANASTSNGPVL